MAGIVIAERAAPPVLQPFLRGLIAADVKAPGDFGHAVEILRGVDVDLADPPRKGRGGRRGIMRPDMFVTAAMFYFCSCEAGWSLAFCHKFSRWRRHVRKFLL